MSVKVIDGLGKRLFTLAPAPLPLARARGADLSFEAFHSDQRLYSTKFLSASQDVIALACRHIALLYAGCYNRYH